MKRYYDEYSDNEGYSSDEYEYEVPACFCGKDAKRRISFTEKNPARPFFNCYKRNWDRQCGFFVWEDELYSDDESSDDESSSLCDSCLEKEPCGDEIAEFEPDQDKKRVTDLPLLELVDQSGDEDECFKCLKLKRKFDEIESARDTWDREKRELLAKLEAVESELRHVKKKAKLANEAEDDQLLPFEKVSNSTVEFDFGEIGKKYELANEANDTPLFEKLSESENETFESDWGQLLAKTKLAMGTDDYNQLLSEKLFDSNDKNKTVESEFGSANEAVDMHPFENVSNPEDETLESDLGQLIAKPKLAVEADGDELLQSLKLSNSNDGTVESEMGQTSKLASETNGVSPFEKFCNPDDETVEPEFGQTKKNSKLAEPELERLFETLSNTKADDEAVESELGQITKKTILANEAIYMSPFDKLLNSEKVTEGEEIQD